MTIDPQKGINRAIALDLFTSAYHSAADSGCFLIGLICALADEVGVDITMQLIGKAIAFDKQEDGSTKKVQ